MPSLECPQNISPYFSFMPGCKRREGHYVCVRACAKGQHSFPEAQGEDCYEGPGSGEPQRCYVLLDKDSKDVRCLQGWVVEERLLGQHSSNMKLPFPTQLTLFLLVQSCLFGDCEPWGTIGPSLKGHRPYFHYIQFSGSQPWLYFRVTGTVQNT